MKPKLKLSICLLSDLKLKFICFSVIEFVLRIIVPAALISKVKVIKGLLMCGLVVTHPPVQGLPFISGRIVLCKGALSCHSSEPVFVLITRSWVCLVSTLPLFPLQFLSQGIVAKNCAARESSIELKSSDHHMISIRRCTYKMAETEPVKIEVTTEELELME